MPTERFFRLSVEKQAVIREAAIEEFARVPFEKVSINQIIQTADISRGSFYTYFEDKRDLLRYIFIDCKESICNFCKDCLEKNQGNLWVMLEELLEYCIDFFKASRYWNLFKNISGISDTEELLGYQNIMKENDREFKRLESYIYEVADKSELILLEKEDFIVFLELCMGSLMVSLAHFKENVEDEEIIKEKFRKKLEIIRHGVCKQ